MNRVIVFFCSVFIILHAASGLRAEETTIEFGRFGKIALYQSSSHPAHVVLFVSGDGGWAKPACFVSMVSRKRKVYALIFAGAILKKSL